MDPTDLSDAQLDQLADQLAGRLPTGTHGDRVVLSRRAFAAASAGVLSTGALMALGVDEASAQAAGRVGTSSDPVDAFAYNLDVQNGATFNGTDISNVGSLSTDDTQTKTIGAGHYHYAGDHDGGDSEARLDNALTAASTGDTIFLENESYTQNRTINKRVNLTSPKREGGAVIGSTWTLNERVTLKRVEEVSGGEIVVDNLLCEIIGVKGFTITVNADITLIYGCDLCDVTFASGTADGRYDLSTRGSASDPGGNNSIGGID